MNKSMFGHLSLLAANLIYSINYSIAKDVLDKYIQPSGFILLRVVGAGILYWITAFFIPGQRIDKEDRFRLFLCGIFGIAINQLLFFKGLSITTPINASIMMVCTPILVLIMGYISLSERFSLIRITGVFIGLAGAVYLILSSSGKGNFGTVNWGDLFVLINACSWGLYLILVKPLMQKYHTITVIKWVFLVGFFMVLPFGFNELQDVKWANIPQYALWEVVFVVFLSTYLAYILNTYALKSLSPTIAGTYIYLQPLLTALFAVIVGQHNIDYIKIISTLLIFTGVYLTSINTVKPLEIKEKQ